MWEIYWLTRLDDIKSFLTALMMISVFVLLPTIFLRHIEQEQNKETPKMNKVVCFSSICLTITTLLFVLIPTQKDALLIFGLGSTIDYIKSNGKVQQLPDKCIDALDSWVESLNKKEDR